MGREVINQQYKQWLELTGARKYVPDFSKPKALWVDLDGTIAMNIHRGHHDYHKVLLDEPRLDVIEMILACNLQLVFMSGRPDSCREDTTVWLEKYFDDVNYLYMRETGDFRNDKIVKEELFWEHLEPCWNIVAAIDDRPRITRLQHDIGIPLVISVQKGYGEF